MLSEGTDSNISISESPFLLDLTWFAWLRSCSCDERNRFHPHKRHFVAQILASEHHNEHNSFQVFKVWFCLSWSSLDEADEC